jgi:hypothetical protein
MGSNLPKKIFFWTLVLLFITTSVLIIFYTIGYRFNMDRGIFVYSGSVTIASNPRNANITVDGKPVARQIISGLNNSFHIDGIKPGEHLLEVSYPEFNSWSKKVNINSGLSTEFWNVLLTRKEYQKTFSSIQNIDRIFLVPSKKLGAFTQNTAQGLSVGVVDLASMEIKTVFSDPGYQYSDNNREENIEWAPQAHRIIIPASKDGIQYHLIAGVETKELINLNEIIESNNLKKVRWDPDHKNFIYYMDGNNLYRMSLDHPTEKSLIAENISSYDITRSRIYYFQLPGGLVYQKSLEGLGDPVQITDAPPDEAKNYKIVAYDDRRIALWNRDNKDFYIFNRGEKDQYFRKLASDVGNFQFSDDGKKLLYWNDWEIFAYFLRDWDTQPIRSENEQMDILRFSEKISNVQWEKDYEHVLFTASNKVKVAEMDYRGQRNVADVIKFNGEKTEAVENLQDNQLFFTDTNENGEAGLSVIIFPEKTGLFQ